MSVGTRVAALLVLPMLVGNSVSQAPPQPAAPRPPYVRPSPAPPEPRFATSSKPITVLENTPIRVLTSAALSTDKEKDGDPVEFSLAEDIVVDGVLIVPQGATLHGTVMRAKRAGKVKGSPELILELTSLDLEGRTYPVYSQQFQVIGESRTPPTAHAAVEGAYYGALAGEIVSTRTGVTTTGAKVRDLAVGAAAGAGAAALDAALATGSQIDVPPEAQLEFYLAAPMAIVPVSQKEAAHVWEQANPDGPALYVRGQTP